MMAYFVRAFAAQAEVCVPAATDLIKPGSDSSTAKGSAICVSVTGSRR